MVRAIVLAFRGRTCGDGIDDWDVVSDRAVTDVAGRVVVVSVVYPVHVLARTNVE